MTFLSIRRWSSIHRWSSLVCTLFLFVICVTGLPLIFADEIDDWLTPHVYAPLPGGTPLVSLDRLATTGHAMYPNEVITSMFVDDDEPQVYVWFARSWTALRDTPASRHFVRFDARTGEVLERPSAAGKRQWDFVDVMLKLHRGLFADLPGELFLGLMGVLFVAATVSGVVLYGPFMRHQAFGTVRASRAARVRWLDLHNLLGITTLVWALVIGTTGVMNELTKPLFALWLRTDVHGMLTRYQDATPPPQRDLSSVQAALDSARKAVPGMTITGITFPNRVNGSPWHYLLWAKGSTPLTSRLFSPILVDARTGKLTAVVRMPWYLRAIEVSRPFHFGDYGGLPLKMIWAALDIIAIAVLGSGLYLWIARYRTRDTRRQRFMPAGGASRKRPVDGRDA